MREQILNKLKEYELLIDKEALDEIAKEKDPLSYLEKVRERIPKTKSVIEKKDLPKIEVIRKKKEERIQPVVKIKKTLEKTTAKADIENFISYFNSRYEKTSRILRARAEMGGAVSIQHLTPGEKNATIIAMVSEKRRTPNQHIIFEVEDPTGKIPVLANKNRPDIIKQAENLVLDEVVGIKGAVGDGILFCNQIIWPDAPIRKEEKKTKEPVAVAFLSDTHIGSNKFMEKEFLRFISWLNGNTGTTQQKKLAEKVSYVVFAGDIVDGVGIYPTQEKELEIYDIEKQFQKAEEYIQLIPDSIQIIISPGNHDAVRLSQPQPPISKVTDRFKQDNITLVSNPATVTLHDTVDILIYHGVSLDAMVSSVPAVANGYKQPHRVVEELVKRRHLCPIYGADIAIEKEDNLIIDEVPDVIHTGHVHVNGQSIYRGIRIINSGAWQSQTTFQKMIGHVPTPCKLPVLDLQNNRLQIINFK